MARDRRREWALALALAACGGAAPEPSSAAPLQEMAAPAEAGGASAVRAIAREATLDLVVDGVADAADALAAEAEARGGHVQAMELVPDGSHPYGWMTLAVPSDGLDEALDAFSALAVRVERRSVTSEDVTAAVVDLDAHRRNQEALEARLVALLDRPGSLEDVLAVERELARVREAIDAAAARQRALAQRVALASVRVGLREGAGGAGWVAPAWSPVREVQEAGEALVSGLQGLAVLAIWGAVVALPLTALALLPAGLLFRWIMRRRR